MDSAPTRGNSPATVPLAPARPGRYMWGHLELSTAPSPFHRANTPSYIFALDWAYTSLLIHRAYIFARTPSIHLRSYTKHTLASSLIVHQAYIFQVALNLNRAYTSSLVHRARTHLQLPPSTGHTSLRSHAKHTHTYEVPLATLRLWSLVNFKNLLNICYLSYSPTLSPTYH